MKLKLNKSLRGKPVGTIIDIRVDKAGTPLELYWRDRLTEAKIDNCCEFIETKKKDKKREVKKDGN